MISHKYKCIFIHIPKTAGTSINSFFHPGVKFHYANPDYDRLFGWCPKRKLHMQHATAKQLIDTELVTESIWNSYYKFTFVRNPWDRAYSDYIWIQNFSKVKGDFKDYINKTGPFNEVLNDSSNYYYLGDHLLPQLDFFDLEGDFKLDFVGNFESFDNDITTVLSKLNINEVFNIYQNKSLNRNKDYSTFYTNSNKKLVEEKYKNDISKLNYHFVDKRYGLYRLKKYF